MSVVVKVENLSKKFRIYTERPFSLQERILGKSARYREIWALQGVSFAVEKGEIVGIIGRNGSGKSTLLKILSRIYVPTSGSFEVRGKTASIIELGAGIHPDLTGRENAYLYGSILGASRKTLYQVLPQIEEFSELGSFFDAPLRTYSLGMIFRLLVSTALMLRPNIFFFDEIVGVGDIAFQAKTFAHLQKLSREDVAVLLVSHNMSIIRYLCHRVLFLEEGQVLAEGKPEEVIQKYMVYLQKRHPLTLKPTGPGGIPIERKKWGSGRMQIEEIVLLNSEGVPSSVFRPLEKMTIRAKIYAPQKVEGFVFSLQWHLADGSLLDGPQVFYHSRPFEGRAMLDYIFDSLPFVRQSFLLSAALYEVENPAVPADYHEKMYELTVMDEGISESLGFLRLPARWVLHNGSPE
ncbi:MAG: ABC transporter ATP-binding protein [bacterium JZ-2024 1]